MPVRDVAEEVTTVNETLLNPVRVSRTVGRVVVLNPVPVTVTAVVVVFRPVAGEIPVTVGARIGEVTVNASIKEHS